MICVFVIVVVASYFWVKTRGVCVKSGTLNNRFARQFVEHVRLFVSHCSPQPPELVSVASQAAPCCWCPFIEDSDVILGPLVDLTANSPLATVFAVFCSSRQNVVEHPTITNVLPFAHQHPPPNYETKKTNKYLYIIYIVINNYIISQRGLAFLFQQTTPWPAMFSLAEELLWPEGLLRPQSQPDGRHRWSVIFQALNLEVCMTPSQTDSYLRIKWVVGAWNHLAP